MERKKDYAIALPVKNSRCAETLVNRDAIKIERIDCVHLLLCASCAFRAAFPITYYLAPYLLDNLCDLRTTFLCFFLFITPLFGVCGSGGTRHSFSSVGTAGNLHKIISR